MILKVAIIQPVYDQRKQQLQFQFRNGLNKKKSNLFANILESKINALTKNKNGRVGKCRYLNSACEW